ncbi:MAG: hypothetical protein ACRDKW_04255 [Actinomycetota bacterium]
MNGSDGRPPVRHLRLAALPRPEAGGVPDDGPTPGDLLDDLSEGAVFLLRDRRIPGSKSTVDRIAVVPGGVWAIGVQHVSGLVERRPNGKGVPPSLMAGGRERILLVERMAAQVQQVRRCVARSAGGDVPVRGALCFVGADWRLFGHSFELAAGGGTLLVASPRALVRALSEPGHLPQARRERLHRQLSAALPPGPSTFARV